MSGTHHYLFVYGTLRLGSSKPMAHRLARHARYIGPATIAGRLYDTGEYPGFVPSSRPGERVHGDLFVLESDKLLAELDQYEGCSPTDSPPQEYERACLAVSLEGGKRVAAWVYCYRWPVMGASRDPARVSLAAKPSGVSPEVAGNEKVAPSNRESGDRGSFLKPRCRYTPSARYVDLGVLFSSETEPVRRRRPVESPLKRLRRIRSGVYRR